MTRWIGWRILAIGAPVAEIVLLIWIATVIGFGWTLLLLFAGLVAGLALMKLAGAAAFRAMSQPLRRPPVEIDETTGMARPVGAAAPTAEEVAEASAELRQSGLLFAAGLLLAVPGVLTDVAGLVLALPWVRRKLGGRIPARPRGTVVQGETVVVDTEGTTYIQTWGATSPPQRPGVVRGQILPPVTHVTEPSRSE